jgi:predicted nucleic acid-binding protein
LSLYLDANIVVPLHVSEPTSELVERWFTGRDDAILLSDLAVGEFAAAISRLVRMGKATAYDARLTLDDFDAWRSAFAVPVENTVADIRAAAQFVRQPFPRLLMPDAIHLATSQRLGATLVTMDQDLVTIAQARGIPVLSPS